MVILMKTYKVSDRVTHKKYGKGVISNLDENQPKGAG